jgi:hypothetical protein
MRHPALVASAVVLALTIGGSPAFAQSNFALVDPTAPARVSGWTFTPSLSYQGAWDDNVLLIFQPEPPHDFLTLLNPRGALNYFGRRSEFDLSYDGSFQMYRQLSDLNSYYQNLSVGARRMLTPHIAVYAHNTFVTVPTTELLNFVAVPFIRTGSKLDDLRGGVDVDLTKYTSLTAAYNFQWVTFGDLQGPQSMLLRGGHSHGGSASLKHQVSDTTALTATYNLQHAFVTNGGTFDVQNADAGIERLIFPETRVFGSFGFSRLGVSEFGPPRTGPAWRAGLTHRLKTTALTVTYTRSYVPAFAFGGTFQNEELVAVAHVPLARRAYANSSVSWRRNEPLEVNGLRLKSVWFEASVGYALQPWVHLEGFYSGAHQEIDRPGGIVGRSRIGFQIVTSKPVRIH